MLRAGALTNAMFKTLLLILPVLLPSWRFFKSIEPSPRVQWAFCGVDGAPHWQELCPRAARVSARQMFTRLFWNAAGNDALFMVSCAERIVEAPTDHSIAEITRRVRGRIGQVSTRATQARFRLVFVSREGGDITQDVLFVSAPFSVGAAP